MSPDGLSETSAVPVGDHWHGRCHFSGLLTGWPVLSVWLNMGSLAVHIIVLRERWSTDRPDRFDVDTTQRRKITQITHAVYLKQQ